MVRIRLTKDFQRDLRKAGAVLVGTGQTDVRPGGSLRIPVNAVFRDGFGLAGGYAIAVNGKKKYTCVDLHIDLGGSVMSCGKAGFAKRTFVLGEAGDVTTDGMLETYPDIRVSIASGVRATQMNAGLATKPFKAGYVIGSMDLTAGTLVGSDYDLDPRTGCEIGSWAGDNSIWRGWAIQAMVNRLPKDVGVSQYSYDAAAQKGMVSGGDSPAVTVGQRTPYMEKIKTADSKKIIRGSYYATDNFWEGPSYRCNTNAPFVVSQGLLDAPSVKTWRYDGGLRTTQNNPAGAARPQWWGHARQTNYDGATGQYSWTCRGLPDNRTSTDAQPNGDTRWDMVSNGVNGFFGDNATDQMNSAAGRAPECRDLNLAGFTLTTRYSISKRGALEARNDKDEYPRYCSVDGNPLVGCWQEIYPLWDRAWAFQNHVYASAMRANITSNATVNIPASWSSTGLAMTKPIAWRITDGRIGPSDNGAWPNFINASGQTVDASAIREKFSDQDMSKVSPFTVPGTNTPFTVSGYGTPMGQQEMTFILTADTDGSWTWPVDKNGRELPRPQIKMTFDYLISNYDDGGSCKEGMWYDDAAFGSGRNNDAAGAHCIEGQVPTLWPLPADSRDYWKRVHDAYITDKDGKRVRNTPNVSFDYVSLTSCLNDKELTVQDNSTKTNVPDVGADFTWEIRISGMVKSFSGC